MASTTQEDEFPPSDLRTSFDIAILMEENVLYNSKDLLEVREVLEDDPTLTVHPCTIETDDEATKSFDVSSLATLGMRLQKADNTPIDDDWTWAISYVGKSPPEQLIRYLTDMRDTGALPTLHWTIMTPLMFYHADKDHVRIYRADSGGIIVVSNGEDTGYWIAPETSAARRVRSHKKEARSSRLKLLQEIHRKQEKYEELKRQGLSQRETKAVIMQEE